MLYNNGDGIKEIKRRLNMALQKLKQMKNIWQGTNRKTKMKLLRACTVPIAIYGLRVMDNISNSCQVDNIF